MSICDVQRKYTFFAGCPRPTYLVQFWSAFHVNHLHICVT